MKRRRRGDTVVGVTGVRGIGRVAFGITVRGRGAASIVVVGRSTRVAFVVVVITPRGVGGRMMRRGAFVRSGTFGPIVGGRRRGTVRGGSGTVLRGRGVGRG
jgi:hypothetical protein